MADADYDRVYDRAGNATAVVLVDGLAGGVWEFEHPTDPPGGRLTVRVAPFGPAIVDRWGEIEAAAGRLATVIAADGLRVERAPAPGALADGRRRRRVDGAGPGVREMCVRMSINRRLSSASHTFSRHP